MTDVDARSSRVPWSLCPFPSFAWLLETIYISLNLPRPDCIERFGEAKTGVNSAEDSCLKAILLFRLLLVGGIDPGAVGGNRIKWVRASFYDSCQGTGRLEDTWT